jgi:hypothetical protein
MPDYRAYFVEPGEELVGYRGFACADDAEAIEKAKRIFQGPTIMASRHPQMPTLRPSRQTGKVAA